MKKYIVLFVTFLIFVPQCVNALSYEMITYDTNIKINENRVANIIEEYNVYFVEDLSSFQRTLNQKLTTIRPN